mgnify:CR=1 FL=1
MKFKRIFTTLIIVLILILGINIVLKNYMFPSKHEEAVDKYAAEYNLDPYFVLAIIKTESKFKADARSHKDAVGLMQITEDTGKWIASEMGLSDYTPDKLYEEDYNIKMGCWYLNNLRDEFEDMDLVVAAYNAGRGRVKEWLSSKDYSENGIELSYIPYPETKTYVDKVNTNYNMYRILYE